MRWWGVKAHRLPVASVALVVLGGVLLFAALAPQKRAEAIAPCVAHSNTDEEASFLALLQAWRNVHITGSLPLTVSAPLNASAAGYARYLANTPGASGHYADGSDWVARATQCGYSSNGSTSAGGEGLAVAESGSTISLSPQGALDIMSAHGGSGINIPANVGLPVKCVGVARAVSSDGRKVAWVAVLFAVSGNCPQAVAGGGNPTSTATANASPSATATLPRVATSTPTATRTPSAAPSPTPTKPTDPRPFKAVIVQLANDANTPNAAPTTPPTVTPPLTTPTSSTATATHTPSPAVSAACGGSYATITALDKLGERVTVTGAGRMTGWYLISETGNQRFDFPAGYMLSGTIQIVSGRDQFSPTSMSLWWIASTVWNNAANDDALLHDCTGNLVQRFDDGM